MALSQPLKMEVLDHNDAFEELKEYDVVVGYESESNELCNMLRNAGVDYVEVNLGESERLKAEFMKHFNVSKLPVLIIKGSPVSGDPSDKIREYAEEREGDILRRIQSTVDPKRVTLFIKGSPENPKCGFTKTLMDILHSAGVTKDQIVYFDILSDEDVRRKLKEINSWPTFPQVYIGGRFIGGLDVVRKMSEKGELRREIQEII
uniref:Glutaredoxin domain-containing protein n=1 Tax=Encephalitozoon cuniculi TaxID=6035 RepID=M1JJ90_ENCCN|nr:hypothetical protein ECU05_1380 [Encephalitozoon cuniculi]